jgi:hypothetical protein
MICTCIGFNMYQTCFCSSTTLYLFFLARLKYDQNKIVQYVDFHKESSALDINYYLAGIKESSERGPVRLGFGKVSIINVIINSL